LTLEVFAQKAGAMFQSLQTQPKKKLFIAHIRWMTKLDMEEVLKIEKDRSPEPWSEKEFEINIKAKNCIGMVAEIQKGLKYQVVGFIVWALFGNRIEIINLGVSREFNRQGVGTTLIDKVKKKAIERKKTRIVTHVNERDLDIHLFLHANGFRAMRVIKRFFGEDAAYRFSWEKKK
jgi:ribosomal-protein-alanine N-acetyltransferase